MGHFHVKGQLTGPAGNVEEVEFLVDSGATLSVVPQALAQKLDLKATRSQRVVIAGGHNATRPIAEVRRKLNGDQVITPGPQRASLRSKPWDRKSRSTSCPRGCRPPSSK